MTKLTAEQLRAALTDEAEDEIYRMAEVDGWCFHDLAPEAVRAIAARALMQQPALKSARDIHVELRSLVREVLKVMTCHHRNTHKPLIERLRKLRDML